MAQYFSVNSLENDVSPTRNPTTTTGSSSLSQRLCALIICLFLIILAPQAEMTTQYLFELRLKSNSAGSLSLCDPGKHSKSPAQCSRYHKAILKLSQHNSEEFPNIEVIQLAFSQALASVKFKSNIVSPAFGPIS